MDKKYKICSPYPSGGRVLPVGSIVELSDVQAKRLADYGYINREPVKIPDAPPEPDELEEDDGAEPSSKPRRGKKPEKPEPVKPDETKPDAPQETK